MTTKLARLRGMDRRELAWRGRAAVRTAVDRAVLSVRPSRWDRRALLDAVSSTPEMEPARLALRRGDWDAAHHALSQHVRASAPRFVIAPSMRTRVAARINEAFPSHARASANRADWILEGRYDLLGYEGLRFDVSGAIDWHFDPVHNRRAPREFWSAVPYLSPEVGDHKIIWELNRHQHWLTLGRAYWLTGRQEYRDWALAQLASWLDANPPLIGINWASMLELALRSVSWIWALNFFADEKPEPARPWIVDLLMGLDRQLTQIERHLSLYFSPNTHLLGEALALYVGGEATPFLAASARRSALGRRVLLDEVARQIATDGGHCERSTHYHRYTLDFYMLALIVANITRDRAAAQFRDAVARLARTARLLADDNGRLPHFGDDDGGAAFPMCGRALDDVTDSLEVASALVGDPAVAVGGHTEEAMWLLADPSAGSASCAKAQFRRPASAHLAETGYYISRSPGGAHLVFDAGAHGYRNGGHAHADALSLVLSLAGVPLLIDPGTHCYTVDVALRDRMRSSALHNTLTLDERSAAVPAGPFHWLTAADATLHRWRTNPRFDYMEASHNGYAPAAHRRRVLTVHDDLIVVADLVTAVGIRRADVHWHVDPGWTVHADGAFATAERRGRRVGLVSPGGPFERFVADEDTGLGWHSPVYGRREPATTLRISRTATAPFWIVTVIGLDDQNEIANVDVLPVWCAAGVLAHSLAVRVTRSATVERVVFAEPYGRERKSVWRAGGIETDAAMLFCRVHQDARRGSVEVAMVDGSFARGSGRAPFAIELPTLAADVYLDQDVLSSLSPGRPHVRDCRIR